MSKKIPGQRPGISPPVTHHDVQQAELRRAEQAKVSDQRLRLDADTELPERYPGLSAEPSALQNVIQAGLSSLAKAQGWEATDNALGVLVKAMVGAGAKRSGEVSIPASLTMDFQRLFKSQVPPGDAAALMQLKKDAQQLVQLATVALGMEGLEGLPKAKQEAQLEADVRAIHGALSDVMKLPPAQRSELLGATTDLVQLKANVLDRSAKALDAAGIDTRARLDALAGILQLVAGYANPNA